MSSAIHPTAYCSANIPVPACCPTMVSFGGPDMTTLYVTSARGGRDPDEIRRFPHSGGLFAMRPGVAGLPKPLFDPEI